MSPEHPTVSPPSKRAFTLIELLLAMTVLLILAGLTIRLLNQTMQSDRIRTGARELQSFFAGARDRAIYAGSPVGVRLLADPANPATIRSFVYVGAPSTFTDGTMLNISPTGQINNVPAVWQTLVARGMLTDGTTINLGGTISANNVVGGTTYSVARNPAGSTTWWVTKAYTGNSPINYALQLVPTILSGDEPHALPNGIVIDLNNSVLPAGWGALGAYINQLDVLFAPGGTVMGSVASGGRIHLVLSEFTDAAGQTLTPSLSATSAARYRLDAPWQANTLYQLGNVIVPAPATLLAMRCVGVPTGQPSGQSGANAPTWPTGPNQTVTDNQVTWQSFAKKPNIIVSLATDTGRVTTHPVDLSDQLTTDPAAPPNSTDTFRFAEIGEVTQ
jgi:prepilin-type N-terminal cleavage/methylation domain-containing protein